MDGNGWVWLCGWTYIFMNLWKTYSEDGTTWSLFEWALQRKTELPFCWNNFSYIFIWCFFFGLFRNCELVWNLWNVWNIVKWPNFYVACFLFSSQLQYNGIIGIQNVHIWLKKKNSAICSVFWKNKMVR